jgi:hypothetical protein
VTTWIPVIAAVAAALFAGWAGLRTKRFELRAQRAMELERRSAVSKAEVFEPFVAVLGELWDRTGDETELTPEWAAETVMPRLRELMKWVGIYGSDDLIWTMHRYMQAVFADVPPLVAVRLLTELMLAFRRDLANPDTKVKALDLMGLRLHDVYENGLPIPAAGLSERDLYAAEGWTPPWGNRFRYGRPLKP